MKLGDRPNRAHSCFWLAFLFVEEKIQQRSQTYLYHLVPTLARESANLSGYMATETDTQACSHAKTETQAPTYREGIRRTIVEQVVMAVARYRCDIYIATDIADKRADPRSENNLAQCDRDV